MTERLADLIRLSDTTGRLKGYSGWLQVVLTEP